MPKRTDATKDETKRTDYEGNVAGRVGLELEERDRVEVTDVRIEGAQQTINFGDVRVVEALLDQPCVAERSSTTHLEIPFEIRKNGTVAIDLSAFTEVIGRAKGLTVDGQGFGTNAGNPPAPNPAPVPNPIVAAQNARE